MGLACGTRVLETQDPSKLPKLVALGFLSHECEEWIQGLQRESFLRKGYFTGGLRASKQGSCTAGGSHLWEGDMGLLRFSWTTEGVREVELVNPLSVPGVQVPYSFIHITGKGCL